MMETKVQTFEDQQNFIFGYFGGQMQTHVFSILKLYILSPQVEDSEQTLNFVQPYSDERLEHTGVLLISMKANCTKETSWNFCFIFSTKIWDPYNFLLYQCLVDVSYV